MFQSTPSGGKATRIRVYFPLNFLFQSTPSGGKATFVGNNPGFAVEVFQSTPSGGKATLQRYTACL